MLAPIDLKDFFLKKLSMENGEVESPEGISYQIQFSFDLKTHVEKENYFRLELGVKIFPEAESGMKMEAEIVGFFEIDQKITKKDQREWYMIVNGAMVLYGVLRGQLAMISGNFQDRKFVLPTVNMADEFQEFLKRETVNSEQCGSSPAANCVKRRSRSEHL